MRSIYYFCAVGVLTLTGPVGCGTDSGCQRTATCPAEAKDAGHSDDTVLSSDSALADPTESSSTVAAPDAIDTVNGESDEFPILVPTNPGPLGPQGTDAGASDITANEAAPVAADAGSLLADAGEVNGSDAGPVQNNTDASDAGSAIAPSLFSAVINISGLNGELTLSFNGQELQAHEDGNIVVTELEDNASYAVSVSSNPTNQACTVSNGEGVVSAADVTNIQVTCANDVATLSALDLETITTTPAFAPSVLSYSAEVGMFVQEVRLDVTLSDPQASISIAAVEGASSLDIPLIVGENRVSIVVTAPSGRTQEYALTVVRGPTRREILAPDASGVTGFANRISVSGDHLFVDRAAEGELPQAFLYQYQAGSWAYVAEVSSLITSPLYTIVDGELCGDTLVVIATPTEGWATHEVHFLRYNNGWTFEKSVNIDAEITNVACDGDTMVFRSNFGTLVYTDGPSGFLFTQSLNVEPDSDSTGQRVAIDSDTLIVGDKNEDSAARGINGDEAHTCPSVNCSVSSGAAYIYERNALGNWQRSAYIKGSNARSEQYFGTSVDISGDWAAVGATGDASTFRGVATSPTDYSETCASGSDTSCAYRSGAVFLYHREALGWAEKAYIKPAGVEPNHEAGSIVSLYGDLLVVGSKGGANASGVAYLFSLASDGWHQGSNTLVQAAPAMNDLFPRRGTFTERGFFGTLTGRSMGQDQIVWFE